MLPVLHLCIHLTVLSALVTAMAAVATAAAAAIAAAATAAVTADAIGADNNCFIAMHDTACRDAVVTHTEPHTTPIAGAVSRLYGTYPSIISHNYSSAFASRRAYHPSKCVTWKTALWCMLLLSGELNEQWLSCSTMMPPFA